MTKAELDTDLARYKALKEKAFLALEEITINIEYRFDSASGDAWQMAKKRKVAELTQLIAFYETKIGDIELKLEGSPEAVSMRLVR